jgi:hypothetical protein
MRHLGDALANGAAPALEVLMLTDNPGSIHAKHCTRPGLFTS